MADFFRNPEVWAEREFGDCELGDLRRTRRTVKFAAQVARNPGASTPGQAKEWKDLCNIPRGQFPESPLPFKEIGACEPGSVSASIPPQGLGNDQNSSEQACKCRLATKSLSIHYVSCGVW